jgi:hypothetical protein
MRVDVIWKRQGTPIWEPGFDKKRSHTPTKDEHISFANYELKENSLPGISVDPSGSLFMEIPVFFAHDNRARHKIASILNQHGFEIEE